MACYELSSIEPAKVAGDPAIKMKYAIRVNKFRQ